MKIFQSRFQLLTNWIFHFAVLRFYDLWLFLSYLIQPQGCCDHFSWLANISSKVKRWRQAGNGRDCLWGQISPTEFPERPPLLSMFIVFSDYFPSFCYFGIVAAMFFTTKAVWTCPIGFWSVFNPLKWSVWIKRLIRKIHPNGQMVVLRVYSHIMQ